ncbi:MAG: type II toxin-antitoxin system RelB/DinJ family antitoxin [Coriobacteriales bacterium]|jgi:DNA-damage-inducible protein J|nr:type II toxin-antitoxin system RelB/DinJ family antitoxin [Coriobacteriales bacterium]
MATKLMSLRIEETLKEEFDEFCEGVGLTTTSAITLFVKATLRERRIPFEISSDPFYSKSNIAVLKESIRQMENGEYVEVEFGDFDDFIESL